MAVGAFTPGGIFAATTGRLLNAEHLDNGERTALATLYVALLTDLVLDSLGVQGEVIVDGPLASNPHFAAVLAHSRPQSAVWVDETSCATSAICYLAGFPPTPNNTLRAVTRPAIKGLNAYRHRWRDAVEGLALARRMTM
jgi:hypothetical protein